MPVHIDKIRKIQDVPFDASKQVMLAIGHSMRWRLSWNGQRTMSRSIPGSTAANGPQAEAKRRVPWDRERSVPLGRRSKRNERLCPKQRQTLIVFGR